MRKGETLLCASSTCLLFLSLTFLVYKYSNHNSIYLPCTVTVKNKEVEILKDYGMKAMIRNRCAVPAWCHVVSRISFFSAPTLHLSSLSYSSVSSLLSPCALAVLYLWPFCFFFLTHFLTPNFRFSLWIPSLPFFFLSQSFSSHLYFCYSKIFLNKVKFSMTHVWCDLESDGHWEVDLGVWMLSEDGLPERCPQCCEGCPSLLWVKGCQWSPQACPKRKSTDFIGSYHQGNLCIQWTSLSWSHRVLVRSLMPAMFITTLLIIVGEEPKYKRVCVFFSWESQSWTESFLQARIQWFDCISLFFSHHGLFFIF